MEGFADFVGVISPESCDDESEKEERGGKLGESGRGSILTE